MILVTTQSYGHFHLYNISGAVWSWQGEEVGKGRNVLSTPLLKTTYSVTLYIEYTDTEVSFNLGKSGVLFGVVLSGLFLLFGQKENFNRTLCYIR